MDDVHHTRLLVSAAKLALLLSNVVESGAGLAVLSCTDPDHDSAATFNSRDHWHSLKQGFIGLLASFRYMSSCYLEVLHPVGQSASIYGRVV